MCVYVIIIIMCQITTPYRWCHFQKQYTSLNVKYTSLKLSLRQAVTLKSLSLREAVTLKSHRSAQGELVQVVRRMYS